MNNYGGYKLKPSSYQIQPNDIIIRVKYGSATAPTGILGIALGSNRVSLPKESQWKTAYTDWRAIETKPGSEAKTGDTVYCIEDTYGSCHKHDIVKVHRYDRASNCIYPADSQKLQNNHITCSSWSWKAKYFIVLVTVDSQSEFPCFRQDISTQNIVKFTGPTQGTVVRVGKSPYYLGYSAKWVHYNNKDVWTPCEDPSSQEASTASFIPFTIVDKRGNETTCVGLSKDNWYISENPNGNRSHHNPKFWTKKEELKDNTNIATVASYASNIDYIATATTASKPTQTKPNTKGKQMNSSLFTDMLKLLTQVEQTDLQKAPSTYAFFYNEDGEYEGTARVANEAEAKALLQKPEHLGYTMRIYSFSDEFTTQIPVVSTIKKPVVAKPAKPRAARKPRTPKAD